MSQRFLVGTTGFCLVIFALGVGVLGTACMPMGPPDTNDNDNGGSDANANTNENSNENSNGSGDDDDNMDDNANGDDDGSDLVDPQVNADDHMIGSSNASVTVVEYSDFECGDCVNFSMGVFPQVKTSYIDTGDVRWIFRHYPLRSIHEFAEGAAQASECAADQIDFLTYHDALYENSPELDVDQLKAIAANLDLDTNVFNACLDGEEKAADVQADLDSGIEFGFGGTPSFIINGRRFFGATGFEDFSRQLDLAIAEAEDDPFGDTGFE